MATASFPFMADFHLTFSLFMKASSSFKLMTLSSTSSTLIGGTEPSSKFDRFGPDFEDGGGASPLAERAAGFFLLFSFWPEWGEETRFGGVIEGL